MERPKIAHADLFLWLLPLVGVICRLVEWALEWQIQTRRGKRILNHLVM